MVTRVELKQVSSVNDIFSISVRDLELGLLIALNSTSAAAYIASVEISIVYIQVTLQLLSSLASVLRLWYSTFGNRYYLHSSVDYRTIVLRYTSLFQEPPNEPLLLYDISYSLKLVLLGCLQLSALRGLYRGPILGILSSQPSP